MKLDILIIGLGRFGTHLLKKFCEMGNKVYVGDCDEEKINSVMELVEKSVIGDFTKPELVEKIGVKDFDMCFVCIGSDFQSSIQITSLLKDMGASRVISKAGSEIHEKFLLRNGADEVVYPERDYATKLAVQYSASNIFDIIELSDDAMLYEIAVPPSWVSKSIISLDVRNKFGLNVLAVQNGDSALSMVNAQYIFAENDHVVIMGNKEDTSKFIKKIK